MLKSHARFAVAALAVTLLIGAPAGVSAKESKQKTVQTALQSNPDLSKVKSDMKSSGAMKHIARRGQKTVFAPRNSAYGRIPPGKMDSVRGDSDLFLEVMEYHIVPDRLMPEDIQGKDSIKTKQGESVMTNKSGDQIILDGCLVVEPPIVCKDGVIYVIDEVLFPERGK